MGDMGLIFTPVLVRCLLGPPGLPRTMTIVALGFTATPNSPIGRYNPPPASRLPPPPPTPSYVHPLYYSSCEKNCSKSRSVS